jgi:hypothetical protein
MSFLISAKVAGGSRVVALAEESSFAGGGGGVEISGADSPSGPSGSDSRSRFSSFEATDWVRREPGGRRREVIGEIRVVGVDEGVSEGLDCVPCVRLVPVRGVSGGDGFPNRPGEEGATTN